MREIRKRTTTLCSIATFISIVFLQYSYASNNVQSKTSTSDYTRGLYISGWNVGNPKTLKHFIDLANRTEINTYVIDVKEDDGLVSYPSSVSEVKRLKNWKAKYNPVHILREFHKNNIRVIGRIVCFKDPVLPVKRPDLAMKNKKGGIWKDQDEQSWLNPYNRECWQYLVDIAKEANKLGFDEIQFDYVRFTGNGDLSAIDYGNTKLSKYEVIDQFLSFARQQMPHTVISADVFGIICESPADEEGIGQYLEYIGKDVDYLSPMIYPSHYALGQMVNDVTFDKPDLDPYGVVYNAITRAKTRINAVKTYRAKLRPYLQDFTDDSLGEGNYQKYGAEQIRQQINAVYKAGYNGWLFWNVNNKYSEDGFLPRNKKRY